MFIHKRWFKFTLEKMSINLFSGFVKVVKLTSPIKPHGFINTSLHSDLDFLAIISDLTKMVPQFGNFIEQFNSLINENSLSVITDVQGNLSMDVPDSMSEKRSLELSNKVRILDRLISTQKGSISDLFLKGSLADSKFKSNNPEYSAELEGLRKSFQTFKDSYKH